VDQLITLLKILGVDIVLRDTQPSLGVVMANFKYFCITPG
jgi:hypothetical protein